MIYDPFQKEAIDYISQGHSVIVSAPTGAGKTVIAEHVINTCLENNMSAIYTAPIKALSNQKFRDFHKGFKDKIGILTGDVSINSSAPILIMTTEIFRNKILESEKGLDNYSWIIFDEIHYLDDYERGTVWEESLIFLPQHMNMLALSATIPNMDEFASWLNSIHGKPIKIVKEDNRPVPLHFYYQCQGELVDNLNKVRKIGYGRDLGNYYRGRRFLKNKHLKPNRLNALIKHLVSTGRLPCIYFVFSRKRCEHLASELYDFNFLDNGEKTAINGLYNELCDKFNLTNEKSAIDMLPLIERGIAYHHAGMLPTLKEVVERLFTTKLLKVIFTTETFALGINMPARTVCFDELRKFYGRFHATIRTRDFYQMAGRAGRRGIDKEGFVYSRINPHYIKFHELKDAIYGSYENVKSRFNASYATILNLYERFGEKVFDIYPSSFHYFRERKKRREKALQLMNRKVDLLKKMGYISSDKLTDKGIFAAKIYGYELPISELYDQGHLNDLSELDLAILLLAMVYEPRKNTKRPPLLKEARRMLDMTNHLMNGIHHMEKKYNINPPSKNFFFHLSAPLKAWMGREDFQNVLTLTDADEGELIRYLRMCIQIMREILDTQAPPSLKQKVRDVIRLINRDIVNAENQLRTE